MILAQALRRVLRCLYSRPLPVYAGVSITFHTHSSTLVVICHAVDIREAAYSCTRDQPPDGHRNPLRVYPPESYGLFFLSSISIPEIHSGGAAAASPSA